MYVYRHQSGISKPEGHWSNRASHIYDTKKHLMKVRLSPLMLEDEAAYSCEITYDEVSEFLNVITGFYHLLVTWRIDGHFV